MSEEETESPEEKTEEETGESEEKSLDPDSEEFFAEDDDESEPLNSSLDGFHDIKVDISVVLGKSYMPIEQFLKLGRGAIIELNTSKDDDLDVCVNGYVMARGEITVVEENVGVAIKALRKKKKT